MPATTLALAISQLKQQLDQHQQALCHRPELAQGIQQISVAMPAFPMLAWLAQQQTYPKFYWQDKDQRHEVASVGQISNFTLDHAFTDTQFSQAYQQQLDLFHSPALRLYGGVAFDPQGLQWDEFPPARFFVPALEIRRQAQQYSICLNLNFSQLTKDQSKKLSIEQIYAQAKQTIETLQPIQPLARQQQVRLSQRYDTPDLPRWQHLIEEVVADSFIEHTPKVVLSRNSCIQSQGAINPWLMLALWQGRLHNSYQYGFQFSAQRAYISCSPERLFSRQADQLCTEALAGTTTRGLTAEEDEALAQALLNDDKNSYENQLVQQHILDMLTPLCDHIEGNEAQILKLAHIQHIHRHIQGQLKPQTTDAQLLAALHPTPAVGGLPRANAMQYIREQEGYPRGWYAGACGYFSKEEAEFSVAIRSALVEPTQVYLFAGAGIVKGSDPKSEWQELENKLATPLSILREF